MTVEIWKPTPGWTGSYEVSNLGNVRSVSRVITHRNGSRVSIKGSTVYQYLARNGYIQVRLWRGGKPHPESVHKLVLTAFTGARPVGLEARHLNGIKSDNRHSNLKWGTRRQNQLDKVAHGTHNQARKTHCPRGHRLASPNLVPSQIRRGCRTCLSCHRERASSRYQGRPFSLENADKRYRLLTEGVAE